MSHVDYVGALPEGFVSIAHTDHCPVAAMQNLEKKVFGFQYHPEVEHTENGSGMLRNFLYNVCGAVGDWSMKDYCNTAIEQVRQKVGDGKVLLALSGGVDSSVVAKLLSKAIGNQLTCIFVDHGLMRKTKATRSKRYSVTATSILFASTQRSVSSPSWLASASRKESAKSSARNLSAYLRKKPKRLARSTFWHRAPSMLTL